LSRKNYNSLAIFVVKINTMKVLVAGATGYLGQYLVKELKNRGFWVRVLIRKESQKAMFDSVDDFFIGQVTQPESLNGLTKDIDWVFSTIGITRQKDGLTYLDVDYQGNSNLLNEALKDGVKSF
jgi:nucleoside-diphosphate-sugar epimerase